ncbi:MAG: SlyX protein [Rhodobacteraceae bacterium]|nr:MAG: SlyX protein [Paracoccaceae bacterium]|tara:strand:+ start:681 stop:881 length:201 start_codon:yes stop_codon:yes gene_type:complete
MDNLESRVTDLEIQLSHQEKMLDELNFVLISQQEKLEKVQKINHLIVSRLQQLTDNDINALSTDLF